MAKSSSGTKRTGGSSGTSGNGKKKKGRLTDALKLRKEIRSLERETKGAGKAYPKGRKVSLATKKTWLEWSRNVVKQRGSAAPVFRKRSLSTTKRSSKVRNTLQGRPQSRRLGSRDTSIF